MNFELNFAYNNKHVYWWADQEDIDALWNKVFKRVFCRLCSLKRRIVIRTFCINKNISEDIERFIIGFIPYYEFQLPPRAHLHNGPECTMPLDLEIKHDCVIIKRVPPVKVKQLDRVLGESLQIKTQEKKQKNTNATTTHPASKNFIKSKGHKNNYR